MSARKVFAGITSITEQIFVNDVTSTTGGGLAITYASSGLVFEYRRWGQSTWTSVTPVTATLGTFVSGGVIADGGLTGAYEIGIPDAAFAAGAKGVTVRLRGVANMKPVQLRYELDAVNYQVAARLYPATGVVTLQAGNTTQATLDAGASSVDNYYRNAIFRATGGTGAGQATGISGYNGTTKVAAFSVAVAVGFDNTTTFEILPAGAVVINRSITINE